MKIHKIELGDIIQYREWEMNDTLKLPALYKIVGISTGTDGCEIQLRSVNDREYMEIIREMEL